MSASEPACRGHHVGRGRRAGPEHHSRSKAGHRDDVLYMQIMVDRIDVDGVGLLGHLVDDRNVNQKLVGRQNGLHAIHAETVLRNDYNPVDGRLGVGTLEYRGEALHVKRRLDFRRTEQHEFVRAGKGWHVTGVVLGGNEF